MAVRLRLMRMGKTKQPVYRVVVMDQRAPRDGRYIEQIGRYDARQEPSLVEIDNERATEWLAKGAQPSETVEKLLNVSGAMNTMKIKTGGIHVVGVHKDTPTPTAEDTASSEDSESAEPVVSQDSEADAPAATQSSEQDDPAEGGGSRGVAPPDNEAAAAETDDSAASETDEPAATQSSETDDPAAGGGSEGGRPPSQNTEEE